MKKDNQRRTAVKLVRNLLMARRNMNIKAEQKSYEILREFCGKHGYDMTEVIAGATTVLQGSAAAIMNGLV